ncbi:MAG: hypothetical protein H6741_08265 [Alphaproteobacteria bacterium]|nr:hypothetical protein [Alphaproteobacteria bacterium]MCB9792712.1 hypothetical protein [Alphaproteobacteria bacterium]
MTYQNWSIFKLAFGTQTQRLGRIDAEIAGLLEELGALLELGRPRADLQETLAEIDHDALVAQHQAATDGFEAVKSKEKEKRISALQAMKPVLLGHIRTLWPLLNGDLPSLLEQRGGSKVLDRFVEASTDAAFVQEALRARYDLQTLTIADGTTAKTLKKLYKVSRLVPDSHTRGNPHLLELKFTRPKKGGGGGYSMGAIRVETTSWSEKHGMYDPDHDSTVLKEHRPTGGLEPVMGTMCHEVGHAVSDDLSIMRSQWGVAEYGGWYNSSPEEIAEKLLEHRGVGACELDEDLVVTLLIELLKNGDCSLDTSDPAVQARSTCIPPLADLQTNPVIVRAVALAAQWAQPDAWPDEETYERMRKELLNEDHGVHVENHYVRNLNLNPFFRELISALLQPGADTARIIEVHHRRSQVYTIPISDAQRAAFMASDAGKTAKWAFENGRTGLFGTKSAGAARLTLGGRVYTRGNNNRYYSYDPEARRTGVTAYQFNAPEEWFAELYAFYYAGKLPEGHPGVTQVLSQLPTD